MKEAPYRVRPGATYSRRKATLMAIAGSQDQWANARMAPRGTSQIHITDLQVGDVTGVQPGVPRSRDQAHKNARLIRARLRAEREVRAADREIIEKSEKLIKDTEPTYRALMAQERALMEANPHWEGQEVEMLEQHEPELLDDLVYYGDVMEYAEGALRRAQFGVRECSNRILKYEQWLFKYGKLIPLERDDIASHILSFAAPAAGRYENELSETLYARAIARGLFSTVRK